MVYFAVWLLIFVLSEVYILWQSSPFVLALLGSISMLNSCFVNVSAINVYYIL